jgi:hypothetical protein
MAEIFTRTEVDFGGAMHAQFGIIVASGGLTGVLMQNIQLSYQQAITRLYELGNRGEKTKVYYVGGRAQGSMSIAHVIGPGVSIKAFYDNFGDVCQAKDNTVMIDLTPNVCATNLGGARAKYLAKYCVLVSVGMSVAAQDFVVNENSQLMFTGLEFDDGRDRGGGGDF